MFRTLKIILLLSFFVLNINKVVSQTKFAVIGDYGINNSNEQAVADLVNTWGVDFIITLGDNNYNNGSATTIDHNIGQFYSDWIGNYQGEHGTGSSNNKFFPTLGNHDWDTKVNSLPEPYLDYFTLPGTGFTNSSGNERYYDFVWDNIHFFAIDSDSNEPDGATSSSAQGQWLQTQLNNCVQNQNHNHWRIVYFHHAPYSSQKQVSSMRWSFEEWGAHTVLAGHTHTYERLLIGNIRYFNNGLGGKNIYSFNSTITGSEVRYNGNYGAMLFETIGATKLRGRFIDINNVTQDDFTLEDTGLPVELVFFTAKLNGNNVELRWRTETEVNNYGFDIERTKDKLNWLTIGFVEGHGNSNSPKQYNFIDNDINLSGEYYYRLKQIDNDGTYEYSDIVTVEVGVPNNFYLSQNYPNPFNPETRIDFTLPEKQLVSLRIYNTLGEVVTELVNEQREAGSYSVRFDASKLPSGVYIYRLQTSSFAANKKMTLLK